MASVNEALKDASVRHHVFVNRYGATTANKILALLNRADADLVAKIAARLEGIQRRGFDPGPATTERLKKLLDEIRVQNRDLYNAVNAELKVELTGLAKVSADIAATRLSEAIGVDFGILRPSPETLRSAVTSQPLRGRLLRDWVKDLESGKVNRLSDAIRLGVVQAETNDQIIRRIRGTRALNYRDGILEITRRGADALVRTAVNHIATRSREMLFEANADVVSGVEWVSTLDSRTCPICAGLDGRIDLDDGSKRQLNGRRPPTHVGCRCAVSPVVRSWDELSRKGALKPGRGARDIDTLFEKRLREKGFSADQIADIKRNTRASMTGQVSGDLTYGQWLRRQTVEMQNDVLGVTKGRLFRSGELDIDRFTDRRTGTVFSLTELRRREAEAWMSAKLPESGSPVLR